MFPEATNGFKGSEGEWLDVKSVLASYGMVSHTFDVNNLISANENEAIWDRDKVLLGEFKEDILQIKWNFPTGTAFWRTPEILWSVLILP